MLHEWSNEFPRNDSSFCEEELYLKKTGEYFLYGKGNATSKYAQYVGNNSYASGEQIRPLTETEAKNWTEHHASVDKYEEIFDECHE